VNCRWGRLRNTIDKRSNQHGCTGILCGMNHAAISEGVCRAKSLMKKLVDGESTLWRIWDIMNTLKNTNISDTLRDERVWGM